MIQLHNGAAVLIPVDMLTSVVSYVKQHHCDAAAFIGQDISRTRTGHTVLPGHTENVYGGYGWAVTVGRPIIPKVFYDRERSMRFKESFGLARSRTASSLKEATQQESKAIAIRLKPTGGEICDWKGAQTQSASNWR